MPVMYFFFFNDTATTEIYTLSLHDALPISHKRANAMPSWVVPSPISKGAGCRAPCGTTRDGVSSVRGRSWASSSVQLRSEEHTSELQSRQYLVCRLLLEKKKNKNNMSQVNT